MYALPPTYKDPVSLEFTWGYPTLSLSPPEVVVSENRKIVMLTIHNFSVSAKSKGSVQKARIPFEWRDPERVPSRIEIEIVVKSNWSKTDKETLIGYNIRSGITEFLIHRSDTSFYFPRHSPIFRIPYWDFSRDAALFQQAPFTTVKSITWPTELAYWFSCEGEEYLVSQVRKVQRQCRSTIPLRVAICPFELGLEFAVCRTYPSVVSWKAAMCGHLKTGHREAVGTSGFYAFVISLSILFLLMPQSQSWCANCVVQTSRHGRDVTSGRAWR